MTLQTDETRRAAGPQPAARRRPLVLLGIGAAVGVAVILSLALGSRPVSLAEVADGLSAWLEGRTAEGIGAIAVQERIPRTVLALVAGAALGLSGALMQAVTRNPIADPGILGVNTGAALFVVCGIAFLGITSPLQYLGLALVGGTLAAAFVYVVGSLGPGGSTPIKLALAGAATTAALSSLVSAVLLPRIAAMDAFRFWQVGGVAGADWATLGVIAPLLAVAALIALFCAPALNALALGDEVAVGLGVKVGAARLIASAAGVALCAAVTAIAGPIAFVGLMVPHVARMLFGPDQRWILLVSALGGAALLAVSDTIGRLIGYPGEVEAGIITAFVGAPILVLIARRTRMKAL
ncbi:iron ABC transporter permease [Microbacterium paludicola]|uniref:Iron ABC transporter permease n=1 Tax=Microbacterium paludicola TaxID=300019 RepID=A0A4Y9FY43_9MICO|nr:iron chelate uptake ABC transporter family permease subunit [Microbacterium paludicola]MBF0815117.1 iron chelate uptake ABC transporter family permease subunit [Microbacterium paludicola]TFU34386.1 iron ABC transporter permease [Microbacterium paludicola]